jgi:processive 1,2-diacylglycerol beta-glucosyltransferase
MIRLFNKDNEEGLGVLTPEQLQFLIDHLEEEFRTDKDYYFDANTLDYLDEEGADPALMEILRHALGDKEGIEIRWSGSRNS